MIEFLLVAFLLAIVGSFAAGMWDLRTTEVPDEVPLLMAAGGLFLWFIYAATTGNFVPLVLSAAFGGGLLAFGWILYKLGQWGGGDAKMFAAIFCLLPSVGIFVNFVLNFFIVALAYMIIYIIILALANRRIFAEWKRSFESSRIIVAGFSILSIAAVAFLIASFFNPVLFLITAILALVDILLLFLSFSKIVDKKLFRKKVPVSKLKVGDVIASSKQWDGITEEQLKKLRKTKKTVEIKEGIRFTLVFPITLLLTWFFGSILLAVIGALG